ncbi:protein FAM47A-like [Perognathus longimembris pacificus]|uniref:protein FAM47A-like n=1 Tax=Perognathus longimembris pacificus TaxID=214514 RepID=UPI002018F80F|nr:protein FAM47A-like [Perognathus longimembris pacificus]
MGEQRRKWSVQPWVLRPTSPRVPCKPWRNDNTPARCLIVPKKEPFRIPTSLDGRRWVFVKEGLEPFKKSRPPSENITAEARKGPFLPSISHKPPPRNPMKMPKYANVYSSLSQSQQARRAYIANLEEKMKRKHPLALYPNLEDNIPEGVLLDVLKLLDPERKLESTWDYCETEKKDRKPKKPFKVTKYSKTVKTCLNPPPIPGKRVDLVPLKKPKVSKALYEAVMRKYIPKTVYKFCEWVQTLGDLDIDENVVVDHFDLGYECIPTYIDTRIKKVNRIPLETRQCRKLSRVKQIRFSIQESNFERRFRKPPDPYKSHRQKIRYGAWYLKPSLWKKLVNNEPLIDPKEFIEVTYPPDIIDELYGTIAFKDYIMSKGYNMPAILEKFFFRKGWDYQDVITPIPRVVRAHELKYAEDEDDDDDYDDFDDYDYYN